MPYRRAVAATWRGACMLSRTILSFSSSHQRRRRPVSTTSSRSIWALRLSLSIGTVLNTAPHSARRPPPEAYVHTGTVGRTSTNERWQAEDCGRQMTDKHPKRPGDLKGPLFAPKYRADGLRDIPAGRSTSSQPRLLAQRHGGL